MKYFVAILESSTYGTWKDTSFSVSSISDAFIQKVTSDDYLLVSFLITSVLEWRARAAGPVLPARWVPYSLSETVGLVAALAASRDLSKWHFSTGGVKSNFSPGPLTSFSHRRLQFSSHSSLYTNLSGRRGETHISLCLNHRVSLGKINQGNDSTSPPALWKERPDSTGKAGGCEQKESRCKTIPFLHLKWCQPTEPGHAGGSSGSMDLCPLELLTLKIKFKHLRNGNTTR